MNDNCKMCSSNDKKNEYDCDACHDIEKDTRQEWEKSRESM